MAPVPVVQPSTLQAYVQRDDDMALLTFNLLSYVKQTDGTEKVVALEFKRVVIIGIEHRDIALIGTSVRIPRQTQLGTIRCLTESTISHVRIWHVCGEKQGGVIYANTTSRSRVEGQSC